VKDLKEEIDRYEKIQFILDEHTINEPYPQFKIEPEIIDYAVWLNGLMPERTLKDIEKEKGEQGLIGQELFNGFLLQFKIPCVYANPLYEKMEMRQWKGKHFDFYIPHMPKGMRFISVKTTPEGDNKVRFMANVESWKNEIHDIAIAIKIDSLKDRKAHIAGWLEAKIVKTLPKNDFGNGLAYWTYLDPEFVEGNKESEIPCCASPKLKPLHEPTFLIKEILKGASYLPPELSQSKVEST
jgi:hypothetical protein